MSFDDVAKTHLLRYGSGAWVEREMPILAEKLQAAFDAGREQRLNKGEAWLSEEREKAWARLEEAHEKNSAELHMVNALVRQLEVDKAALLAVNTDLMTKQALAEREGPCCPGYGVMGRCCYATVAARGT